MGAELYPSLGPDRASWVGGTAGSSAYSLLVPLELAGSPGAVALGTHLSGPDPSLEVVSPNRTAVPRCRDHRVGRRHIRMCPQ